MRPYVSARRNAAESLTPLPPTSLRADFVVARWGAAISRPYTLRPRKAGGATLCTAPVLRAELSFNSGDSVFASIGETRRGIAGESGRYAPAEQRRPLFDAAPCARALSEVATCSLAWPPASAQALPISRAPGKVGGATLKRILRPREIRIPTIEAKQNAQRCASASEINQRMRISRRYARDIASYVWRARHQSASAREVYPPNTPRAAFA